MTFSDFAVVVIFFLWLKCIGDWSGDVLVIFYVFNFLFLKGVKHRVYKIHAPRRALLVITVACDDRRHDRRGNEIPVARSSGHSIRFNSSERYNTSSLNFFFYYCY